MKKLISIATLSLVTAACTNLDKGDFGLMERSLNRTSYGYSIVKDPTENAPTNEVERFELRAGDCFDDMGYGWSDCENDRERTELKQVGNNRYGSTAWYGWYIYIPNTYENINPVKVALGQFHQRSAKPVFMFQNSYGGLHIDWQVRGNTKTLKPIISEENLRGRWHQIEVHARWRKDEEGFFRVFVNGEKKFDHTGRTAKRSTYFKYGIYRSFVTRYFEDGDIPTQVVYFAGVKKGATREDIQTENVSEQ